MFQVLLMPYENLMNSQKDLYNDFTNTTCVYKVSEYRSTFLKCDDDCHEQFDVHVDPPPPPWTITWTTATIFTHYNGLLKICRSFKALPGTPQAVCNFSRKRNPSKVKKKTPPIDKKTSRAQKNPNLITEEHLKLKNNRMTEYYSHYGVIIKYHSVAHADSQITTRVYY